jgi:AraC-like ligand binding domain
MGGQARREDRGVGLKRARSNRGGGIVADRHEFLRNERRSHDTCSPGVTSGGVQCFACRGTRHDGVPGDLILFNPDESHAHLTRAFTHALPIRAIFTRRFKGAFGMPPGAWLAQMRM